MKKEVNIKKILNRQRINIYFYRPLFFIISRLFLHFRSKDKYKLKKNEPAIILANHQTDFDFILILTMFNRPISFVGTDNIFNGPLFSNYLMNHLGVIPKKKGVVDITSTLMIMRTLKANGCVCIAPEGNRTYAEFQYHINEAIISLIRKTKAKLILLRLEGGTGSYPRFKNKKRSGKFTSTIARVLDASEYDLLTDEELLKIIKDNIRFYDSKSGNLYYSKRRAEYLEKMLFVCPNCLKMNTLKSKNEHLYCTNCNLDVIYNLDLSLGSKNSSFHFKYLIDWWNFQKRYVKELDIKDGIIFEDDIILRLANPFKKRTTLYQGRMELTKDELRFGSLIHELKDIASATIVSGGKLIYQINDDNYLIKSKNKRFNPLKYIFMFNKLDTLMKKNNSDVYYNLEED